MSREDAPVWIGCSGVLLLVAGMLWWIGWDNLWGGGVIASNWLREHRAVAGGGFLVLIGLIVVGIAASRNADEVAGCGCLVALVGLGVLGIGLFITWDEDAKVSGQALVKAAQVAQVRPGNFQPQVHV